jgi:hypothetical protein
MGPSTTGDANALSSRSRTKRFIFFHLDSNKVEIIPVQASAHVPFLPPGVSYSAEQTLKIYFQEAVPVPHFNIKFLKSKVVIWEHHNKHPGALITENHLI